MTRATHILVAIVCALAVALLVIVVASTGGSSPTPKQHQPSSRSVVAMCTQVPAGAPGLKSWCAQHGYIIK